MARFTVIDLRHDPRLDPAAPKFPRRALRVWEHYAAIGESATATWGGLQARLVAVRCRRRPERIPCRSYLYVVPGDEGAIEWSCPRCEDGGVLTGWQGSHVDLSGVAVGGEHATDPDAWYAALLPPEEYRLLFKPGWGFSPLVRRILRAARPTRPGIRLEAPRAAWNPLVGALAQAGAHAGRAATRRALERVRQRLLDATHAWE